jgi:hypothetical protein
MGKYIGRDNPYGLFEKQQITITQDSSGNDVRTYNLNYIVSGAASVLVVCERAVLEPDVDYAILQGNAFSRLELASHIDLTPADGSLSLYVVYLGKQLSVPGNSALEQAIQDLQDRVTALEEP